MTTAGLGVIGAAVALLAGGWLMYAPFVLGYQRDFSSWNDATTTDFWDGFGLAVLAVLALVVTGSGLVAVLRQEGVIAVRRRIVPPDRPEPVPVAPSPAPSEELAALLRPLLEALNRDNAEGAQAAAATDVDDAAEADRLNPAGTGR